MQTITPEFMKWVTITIDGWVLSTDAPDYIRDEFDEYMDLYNNIQG